MQSRMPNLGDLLVVTCQSNCIPCEEGIKHSGLVTEIVKDVWGHQQIVRVSWSTKPPRNYNEAHGYSGTNIHNCRSEFQVFRGGVNIP